MVIDVLTIFPKMFTGFLTESIIKRAQENALVTINIHDFREYSRSSHHKVDDTPYGGGAGMVLMCQPIFDAVNALKKKDSKVIIMSPVGDVYKQKKAYELSKLKHLIILCGHYEDFDERIYSLADEVISIGDYVLTGGELASMVLIDSITRLVKGVIEEESHLFESFNNGVLDYPTYTKPRIYNGISVPDVLINGDHQKIALFRDEMSLERTKKYRPDLLKKEAKDE